MVITRERVRQFEMILSRSARSLMHASDTIPDNGQGHASFERR